MNLDLHPILLYVATAAVLVRFLFQELQDVLRAAVKLVRCWRGARAQVGGQKVTTIVVIAPRAAPDQPRSADHGARLVELHSPPERLDAPETGRRRLPNSGRSFLTTSTAVRASRRRE
jgi:hypothetical protein